MIIHSDGVYLLWLRLFKNLNWNLTYQQAAVTDVHPVPSGFVTSGGDGILRLFRDDIIWKLQVSLKVIATMIFESQTWDHNIWWGRSLLNMGTSSKLLWRLWSKDINGKLMSDNLVQFLWNGKAIRCGFIEQIIASLKVEIFVYQKRTKDWIREFFRWGDSKM